MEHRQLRYFVTPVEELHFSRAAAREHIVQSPLSQQLQRLERKLGILLLDRTTHHVQLTPAGSALLVEARQILEHVKPGRGSRAACGQLDAGLAGGRRGPQLRLDATDPAPETGSVPGAGDPPGRGRGARAGPAAGKRPPERWDRRVSLVPPEVISELFRLDPLGMLVPEGHRLAASQEVPVAKLAAQLAPSRRSCAGVVGAA